MVTALAVINVAGLACVLVEHTVHAATERRNARECMREAADFERVKTLTLAASAYMSQHQQVPDSLEHVLSDQGLPLTLLTSDTARTTGVGPPFYQLIGSGLPSDSSWTISELVGTRPGLLTDGRRIIGYLDGHVEVTRTR